MDFVASFFSDGLFVLMERVDKDLRDHTRDHTQHSTKPHTSDSITSISKES